jgi:hypothetical protein
MLMHAYFYALPVLENPSIHACRHMADVVLMAHALSLPPPLSLSLFLSLSPSLNGCMQMGASNMHAYADGCV